MKKISKCPACGAGIKNDADTCEYCGTKFVENKEDLSSKISQGVNSVIESFQNEFAKPKTEDINTPSNVKKSSGSLFIPAIILFFIFPPIGVFLFIVAIIRSISK